MEYRIRVNGRYIGKANRNPGMMCGKPCVCLTATFKRGELPDGINPTFLELLDENENVVESKPHSTPNIVSDYLVVCLQLCRSMPK